MSKEPKFKKEVFPKVRNNSKSVMIVGEVPPASELVLEKLAKVGYRVIFTVPSVEHYEYYKQYSGEKNSGHVPVDLGLIRSEDGYVEMAKDFHSHKDLKKSELAMILIFPEIITTSENPQHENIIDSVRAIADSAQTDSSIMIIGMHDFECGELNNRVVLDENSLVAKQVSKKMINNQSRFASISYEKVDYLEVNLTSSIAHILKTGSVIEETEFDLIDNKLYYYDESIDDYHLTYEVE